MRGEDALKLLGPFPKSGSPPHARGRPRIHIMTSEYIRITPACAGKTNSITGHPRQQSDHPRMRGEDSARPKSANPSTGSPPHARGRHTFGHKFSRYFGITPACAGKTSREHCWKCSQWDHPRMRGEDGSSTFDVLFPKGSPPHARGRRLRRR